MTGSAPKVPETVRIPIVGRMVTVSRPTETQIALMHRQGIITSQALDRALKLQDAAEEIEDPAERAAAEEAASPHFAKGLGATGEILDIMEFLVIDEDDREYVHDQMKRGAVEITDLFEAFEKFRPRKKAKGAPKAAKRLAD